MVKLESPTMDELVVSRSKLLASEREKDNVKSKLLAATDELRRVRLELERCEERAADAQNAATLGGTAIAALQSEWAGKILQEQNAKDKLAGEVRRLSLLLRDGAVERLQVMLEESKSKLSMSMTARDALQKALDDANAELIKCRDELEDATKMLEEQREAAKTALAQEQQHSAQLQAALDACTKEWTAEKSKRAALQIDLHRARTEMERSESNLDAADKKMATVLVGDIVERANKQKGRTSPSLSKACSQWPGSPHLSSDCPVVLHDLEDMRRQLELALQGSQRYEQLAESLQSALTASREALARAGTELEEERAALRDANMELIATRNRFTVQEGDMARKMLQRDDTMTDARQLCRGAWNCPQSAQFLS